MNGNSKNKFRHSRCNLMGNEFQGIEYNNFLPSTYKSRKKVPMNKSAKIILQVMRCKLKSSYKQERKSSKSIVRFKMQVNVYIDY